MSKLYVTEINLDFFFFDLSNKIITSVNKIRDVFEIVELLGKQPRP